MHGLTTPTLTVSRYESRPWIRTLRNVEKSLRGGRARLIALVLAIGLPVLAVVLGLMQQGLPAETIPPPLDAEPGRWIDIDGAQNTRDIGGYVTADGRTVRRSAVYRSGTLSHVTDAGCDTFTDLGVATVVDYRNRLLPVPLYNGDVFCVHRAVKMYGFPVSFRSEGPEAGRYLQGLEENAEAFCDTFDLLAEPERLPLMYHCAAGTDRTGVMTALLLRLLGVDRNTVLDDFKLSAKVGTPGNLEGMLALLDEVETAGGIETFLERLGVPATVQQRVRENLLE
ncbi:tyrosine-protein phosphatase [uncultured Ilyobacter sp.]|uniref:tyrosine-protein phosphatase n=1 Tax=uncultured Ilyobacter sp. TaxID=544433 RepID=UPI0029F551BC|nr:tyrosine-protein phosphatase [uncultured Ilyobacter sp.]